MRDMVEIRWHGRGGQGAKTAAQLLAEAAMESGRSIQAFPEYGPERAGAPIKAFTRISDDPIDIHSGVSEPDVVVVIDPTLLDSVDVTEGLGDDGLILVNSSQSPDQVRKTLGIERGKVGTVDATTIALDTLGRPMTNLPMVGALLKARSIVPVDVLETRIEKKFSGKIGEEKTRANISGTRRAYEEVRLE